MTDDGARPHHAGMAGTSWFDTHEGDILQQPSSFPAIPAATTEVTVYDTTRVPEGTEQMDPAAATGKYSKTCLHLKAAIFALLADQIVTVKVYWMIQGTWVVMNGAAGAGNATTANVGFQKVYPFGGEDVKITYTTGGTPPGSMKIANRFSKRASVNAMP